MFRTAIRSALIALAVPTAATATTYDAYSSFNGTNPAGNFQYKSAGFLLTAPAGDCVSGLIGLTCLQPSAGSSGAGFYTSQNNMTLSTEGGMNNVHINNTTLAVSPDTGAGAFFVAPTPGTYAIEVSGATSPDYQISFHDGTLAINQASTTTTLVSSDNPSVFGQSVTFTQTVTLDAGDIFGFLFGPGTNNSHDLTAFTFTVSDAVPEPATWMTMLLGFAMLGMTIRRRTSPKAGASAN